MDLWKSSRPREHDWGVIDSARQQTRSLFGERSLKAWGTFAELGAQLMS